ncbi:MAG TPA: DUF4153 domain-containing protein [Leadbetterella sp.]|nr:DUF4153 domain-containing protein [Leadbetterella sp.]
MAKFFSLENLKSVLGSFITAIGRFPVTLLTSLAGTILFVMMATDDAHSKEIEKLATTLLLFLPLFFSAEVFEERRITPKFLILGLSILAFVLFYFFGSPAPADIFYNKSFMIKYGVLVIVFHLLVSVAPYIFKNNPSGFWQYNKTLFINILTAFLYSGTLSAGLVLAFSGIQNLFELNLSNDWYVYIWFGVNGFFNTLIFTSKLPSLDKIDAETEFPIGLKYFTQYVLLPLVAIYLGILVAYEAKIALQWSLPKGWVSIMVLASAIFGILAFLLIYPLKEANKWIQTYTKLYYWILLPLVALMMVAIYVRISQYGLTEPRFFVALLSVWLLGVSLYFSISKVDNIKIIPLSLLLVGLFGIYAPFNAFQSSRINQEGRLEEVLNKYKLLKDDKIAVPVNVKLDSTDEDRAYAALEYLSENQPERLEKYLTKKQFDELIAEKNEYNRGQLVMKLTGFPQKKTFDLYKYFSVKNSEFLVLDKADFLISPNEFREEVDVVKIGNDTFTWDLKQNQLNVNINSKEKIGFDLNELTKFNAVDLPESDFTFSKESENFKMKLFVESGNSTNGVLENLKWKLLLTKKK